MNVGVRVVFNLPAAQTFVAAIGRRVVDFDRILAVQSFCQRARQQLQFVKLVAGEKISMAEAPAGERALQQLNALCLIWKIFEGHVRQKMSVLPATIQTD